MGRRRGIGWACGGMAGAICSATVPAHAEPPLTQNDYSVELFTGPVLASGRITGMGGAHTALASGIDGAPYNPAAYGSRTLWELTTFEWELTGSILFPGSFSNNDFYNTGRGFEFEHFLFFDAGARFQIGNVGFGLLGSAQVFTVGRPDGIDRLIDVTFSTGDYGFAHQMLDGQLVVGVGARTSNLVLSDAATQRQLVSFTGTGFEAGVLLRFEDEPWRLGVSGLSPVSSTDVAGSIDVTDDGVQTSAGFVLPDNVHIPWQLRAGFALQLGERPLNRRFVDPHEIEREHRDRATLRQWNREREQLDRERGSTPREPVDDPYRWLSARANDPEFWAAEERRRAHDDDAVEDALDVAAARRYAEVVSLPRRHLLLTVDVLATGRTPRGVGVEGFLAQERVRAGESPTFSFFAGAEAEPIHNLLKARIGGYLEPSRYATGSYRPHLTSGLDLCLFRTSLFGLVDPFDVRVTGTIDIAARYTNWGVGVGFWH